MHDEGKGMEALTSVSKLLGVTDNRDYEEWLKFIIEASGTTDSINQLKVWISILALLIFNYAKKKNSRKLLF